jgi:hypothetical protein
VIVNILDRLSNLNSHSDTAPAKEKATYSMWEAQKEAILVFHRAKYCKCIDELLVQNWTQEINTVRQSSQDSFLLAKSIDIVNEKVRSTVSQFQTTVESYISRTILLERGLDVKTRVQRLNDGFTNDFDLLAHQQIIEPKIKQDLYNQLKIYAGSLTKNINDVSLRSSIRDELLHSLVDDFHREIYTIYRKAASTRKRI